MVARAYLLRALKLPQQLAQLPTGDACLSRSSVRPHFTGASREFMLFCPHASRPSFQAVLLTKARALAGLCNRIASTHRPLVFEFPGSSFEKTKKKRASACLMSCARALRAGHLGTCVCVFAPSARLLCFRVAGGVGFSFVVLFLPSLVVLHRRALARTGGSAFQPINQSINQF